MHLGSSKRDTHAVSQVVAEIITIALVVSVFSAVFVLMTMATPDLTRPSFLDDIPDDFVVFIAKLHCPANLLIYNDDIDEYKIGYDNEKFCANMNNAEVLADEKDGREEYLLNINKPYANEMRYRVRYTDDGVYSLYIESVTSKKKYLFSAIDIPGSKNENHEYKIEWPLSRSGVIPRVSLRIDQNGDGMYEHEIIIEDTEIRYEEIQAKLQEDKDNEQLSLTVELRGVVSFVTRCISIQLLNHRTGELETIQQEISFTNGIGSTSLDIIDGNAYNCISIKDSLHTLRQTSVSMKLKNGMYQVSFTGDNALIGGDLNNDDVINKDDFNIYSSQLGTTFGTGDANCDTPLYHADINGDGKVNEADGQFIQQHFDTTGEAGC